MLVATTCSQYLDVDKKRFLTVEQVFLHAVHSVCTWSWNEVPWFASSGQVGGDYVVDEAVCMGLDDFACPSSLEDGHGSY
jgi:hypothetical protein